jgi:hypothetical protein
MAINVDVPPVDDEQAALTLMVHHLQLAAAYFEATPSEILTEDVPDTFSKTAIIWWLQGMEALYPEEDN